MNRCRRTPATVVLLSLGLAGCLYLRPTFAPRPWDRYGDAGALRVHGAHPSTAGPVILRALEHDPKVADLLATEGEPDTLEVRGRRLEPKRVILFYRRASAGKPRRIVLDPSNDGYIARMPEPLRTRRRSARATRTQPRTVKAGCTDCPRPQPTAAQHLECPIDPGRDDCRAFCTAGAPFDWCRR